MINMENIVEVTPASPPAHVNDLNCNISGPESPEIRVTETPESEACSSPRRSSSPHTSEARAPLIFQPFLPLPGGPHHRTLPFSIDNILKPTFGPRTLLQNPAFFSLAAAAASAQQKLMTPERQRSPSSSSSSNGSLVKSEHKSPPSSPINHNNNQPVDLSSKNGNAGDAKNGKKADDQEGVPPGMVRGPNGQLWPAWVFCTRYSDRPSSGPRMRKIKKKEKTPGTPTAGPGSNVPDEKRPRTAFSSEQLARLRKEFDENRYLNEDRRRALANELGLNETQIKIWFQNKRAKLKKATGTKGDLAKMLAAQGLYNHATVPVDEDEFPAAI